MTGFLRLLIVLFIISSVTLSCDQANETAQKKTIDQVVIGATVEPVSLNPILAKTSGEREIHQYLFARLADYDYESQKLKPVLLESIPDAVNIETGEYAGLTSFTLKIKEDAKWSNGDMIDGSDVSFTFKMASHPGVVSPSWKQITQFIKKISIDPEDSKKITIYVDNSNFQNKEYLLSAEILPQHIYDAENYLADFDFVTIKNASSNELAENASFNAIAEKFSSIEFGKNIVAGAGPYELEKWESGQYIVLKKKENYWGEDYREIDQLESYPERVVFQFVSDVNSIITLLKNDELDVVDLSKIPYTSFDDLKVDSAFASRYHFYNPQIPRYLILLLNNEDVRLRDLSVRKAIAHCTDVDRIIRQLEGGYAKRINSPIHFTKTEYNSNLPLVEFDLGKANSILEEAGWTDSNNNGIRDKVIDGRLEELDFRFHITGSAISTSLYSIIKETSEQIGINIESVIKPFGATRSENLISGDYDMTVMLKTSAPVKRDLTISYHSSSIGQGGQNYQRYSNEEADQLMELIRTTTDEDERDQAYQKIQEVITGDFPVVYLFSQQLRIVGDRDFELSISDKRPGYFVNAIAEK